ncbi:MAG: hypothetical protein WD065_16770 [Planctomycetaceae bacterium]
MLISVIGGLVLSVAVLFLCSIVFGLLEWIISLPDPLGEGLPYGAADLSACSILAAWSIFFIWILAVIFAKEHERFKNVSEKTLQTVAGSMAFLLIVLIHWSASAYSARFDAAGEAAALSQRVDQSNWGTTISFESPVAARDVTAFHSAMPGKYYSAATAAVHPWKFFKAILRTTVTRPDVLPSLTFRAAAGSVTYENGERTSVFTVGRFLVAFIIALCVSAVLKFLVSIARLVIDLFPPRSQAPLGNASLGSSASLQNSDDTAS